MINYLTGDHPEYSDPKYQATTEKKSTFEHTFLLYPKGVEVLLPWQTNREGRLHLEKDDATRPQTYMTSQVKTNIWIPTQKHTNFATSFTW